MGSRLPASARRARASVLPRTRAGTNRRRAPTVLCRTNPRAHTSLPQLGQATTALTVPRRTRPCRHTPLEKTFSPAQDRQRWQLAVVALDRDSHGEEGQVGQQETRADHRPHAPTVGTFDPAQAEREILAAVQEEALTALSPLPPASSGRPSAKAATRRD